MKPRHIKALKALVVFLSFAFSQVYVSAALPALNPGGGVPQRTVTARLTTRNNQPITVNGIAAGTGATILTGASIETPDQVGATIDLGDAGVVELQPNSKIQLDFDENGNVRVKVVRGCAVTKKKTNVLPGEMELYTDQSSEKTDKKRRHLAGCYLPNGTLGSMGGINGWVLGGLIAGGTGATVAGIAASRGGTTSVMTPP